MMPPEADILPCDTPGLSRFYVSLALNRRPQIRRVRLAQSQLPHRGSLQQAECQAESRSATMEFFENKENNKKSSIRTAGDGDSNAVPFHRPLLLLGDARTLLRKRKLCPKKLCHLRGSPQQFPSNFRPIQGQDKQR